jgi:hypothetical protein
MWWGENVVGRKCGGAKMWWGENVPPHPNLWGEAQWRKCGAIDEAVRGVKMNLLRGFFPLIASGYRG